MTGDGKSFCESEIRKLPGCCWRRVPFPGSRFHKHGTTATQRLHLPQLPMANWFKLYETDLDDANLQYAMDHNPHTAMVYFGLLTECCKIRGNTLPWTLALELPALAKKVHLSIGVTNDAVGWLRQIGRVTTGDGIITVTGWESRQSDYMNRKVNHQSVHSQTEERRGDKRGTRGIKVKSGPPSGERAYLIVSSEGHEAGADAIVDESIERVTHRPRERQ